MIHVRPLLLKTSVAIHGNIYFLFVVFEISLVK